MKIGNHQFFGHALAAGDAGKGTRLLPVLAAVSGSCALAYEVILLRLFSAHFGDSLFVGAILLTSIFLGLAFGAWQSHRLLRHLPLIEILIGFVMIALGGLFHLLGLQVGIVLGSGAGATIAKLIGLLVVPAFLVGTCLPLFSDLCNQTGQGRRNRFDVTYLIYNLGGLISIVTVQFVLIEHAGTIAAMTIFGIISVLIGIVLLTTLSGIQRKNKPEESPNIALSGLFLIAFLLISLASGFFQMSALRLSYAVFGPLQENFAALLISAILGLALGTRLDRRLRLGLYPAAFLIAVGVAGFAAAQGLTLQIWSQVAGSIQDPATFACVRLIFITVLPLPVFTLFGMTLPLAIRVGDVRSARGIGRIVAINGLGNGLGTLTFLLIAHEHLATAQLLPLAAATVLVASLVGIRQVRPVPALLGGALIMLPLFAATQILWPERQMLIGYKAIQHPQELQHRTGGFLGARIFRSQGREAALVSYRGQETTLMFDGYRSLTFSPESHTALYESLVGVVPTLFAAKNSRALVLGLGTGITGGATSQAFRQTDIAEINPTMTQVARHFDDYNFDVLSQARSRILLQDGITVLGRSDRTYDAIINTVTGPYYHLASKLYTHEFFELARASLKPGGVYAGWFDLNIGVEGAGVLLETLRRTFAGCRYFLLSPGYFTFVCADGPILYQSSDTVRERLSDALEHQLQSLLGAAIPLNDIALTLEVDPRQLAHLTADRPNTLTRPLLENLPIDPLSWQRSRQAFTLIVRDELENHQQRYGQGSLLARCQVIRLVTAAPIPLCPLPTR